MNKQTIKNKTNLYIGYANFERSEQMKRLKLKHLSIVALAIALFVSSIITVNALTENKIGDAIQNTVENILKIKVNNEDYNAKCENAGDKIKCTLDDERLNGTEIEIEQIPDADKYVEFEFETE